MAIRQINQTLTTISSMVSSDKTCTSPLSPELSTRTAATSSSATKVPITGLPVSKTRSSILFPGFYLQLSSPVTTNSMERGLTHLDVDTFVDNVFVRGSQWASRVPETLTGSYVFVCCHQNRDKRCGLCGPVLVERFKEEIESRSMKHQVFVSPCSHLGGHQYAGNLIIFSLLEGKCEGHWYGYVTPNDVPILLDEHIGKGKIVERFWRGRMGSLNSEGKKFEEPKLQQNSCGLLNGASCCSGADRVSCCANKTVEENTGVGEKNMRDGTRTKGLGRL